MRLLRAVLLVLLTAGSLVLLGPATAYACSCTTGSAKDEIDRSSLVADVTVVQRRDPGPLAGSPTTRYLVDVHRVLKGEATSRMEVGTASSSAACGLEDVQVDDRTVFFLYRSDRGSGDPDTVWAAHQCGGTGRFGVDEVARAAGVDLTATPPDPATLPAAGGPRTLSASGPAPLALAGLTVLAVSLVGAVLALRRRVRG